MGPWVGALNTSPCHRLLGIIEAVWTHDAEAHEEDPCVGVGEGPEPVVLLLAGRVEESENVGMVTSRI